MKALTKQNNLQVGKTPPVAVSFPVHESTSISIPDTKPDNAVMSRILPEVVYENDLGKFSESEKEQLAIHLGYLESMWQSFTTPVDKLLISLYIDPEEGFREVVVTHNVLSHDASDALNYMEEINNRLERWKTPLHSISTDVMWS